MSDPVSTTALAVALVALVVAVGQLLQQIFGTAEGYRRCNASVIGPWSGVRFRKFRFSELRMETQFMTPHFTLTEENKFKDDAQFQRSMGHLSFQSHSKPGWTRAFRFLDHDLRFGPLLMIDGTDSSRHNTLTPKTSLEEPRAGSHKYKSTLNSLRRDADYVGWLVLLQSLHDNEKSYEALSHWYKRSRLPPPSDGRAEEKRLSQERTPPPNGPSRLVPAIQPTPRFWDTIPPDVVRPLASTTLGDILVLAHRLGMECELPINPVKGQISLNGSGHSLAILDIRGVGLVLQYSRQDFEILRPEHLRSRLPIPSRDADKLGFGILPGCGDIGIETKDLVLGGGRGSIDQMMQALDNDYLHTKPETRRKLSTPEARGKFDRSEPSRDYLVGFNDLVYLNSGFLPVEGVGSTKFRMPWRQDLEASPLNFCEGHVAFWVLLKKQLYDASSPKPSAQMQQVFECLDNFRSRYPDYYNLGFPHLPLAGNADNEYKMEILQRLREIHDLTTIYFGDLTRKYQAMGVFGGFSYQRLLASHIDMAVEAHECAKKKHPKDQFKPEEMKRQRLQWLVDQTWEYVHRVPDIVTSMQEFEKRLERGDIVDAWWTMMLRGMAWRFSISRIYSVPIPSQFWASELLVHIA